MAHSTGGYYNELDFLTHIPILNNDDNLDTIWNEVRGEFSYDNDGNIITDDDNRQTNKYVIFKDTDVFGTNNIKNYYKENIYKNNDDDLNPYLKLIRDFESPDKKALRIAPADLAYLKNLGRYPMNRMWILRRFGEGVIVPNNLNDWGEGEIPYPLATAIGWINPDDDNFFNMNFSEEWTTIKQRLDEVVSDMLGNEFLNSGGAGKVLSIPGWSQGLLFGFLNRAGLTDFDEENIPQGNPNVLQEGATRAIDSDPDFGLKSTIDITLETEYEQKFINDIDPASAMLDIIRNLLYLGTSEVQYIFKNDTAALRELRQAAQRKSDYGAWWNFIKSTVEIFTNGVKELVSNGTTISVGDGKTSGQKGEANVKQLSSSAIETTLKALLTSTLGKYKWALKGSIGLMTGENTTPWHLIIGNPYSPFFSVGNVVVDDINLSFSNELSFNDIPTRVKATIKIRMGRNMGAQELFRTFNNNYFRVYNKDNNNELSKNSLTKLNDEEKTV